MDNSNQIVKELIKEDQRIILITNSENKGTLYTKTRGILNAKGKYVLTLDHDNLYSSKYALSILYEEAEKNNLDLLGFSSLVTGLDMKNLKKENFKNYIKTPIIVKPFIKDRFLNLKMKKKESETFICLYFIKTELFIKIIKKLGNNLLNRNIDYHDDTIMIFLLSRYANNLKHIKKILHLILAWPSYNNSKIIFQNKIKYKYREQKKCISFLTFIEVLFLFTENNIEDKEIASTYLRVSFLNNECRKNKNIINVSRNLCKLFLENNFIKSNIKKEIKQYLNENKNITNYKLFL